MIISRAECVLLSGPSQKGNAPLEHTYHRRDSLAEFDRGFE